MNVIIDTLWMFEQRVFVSHKEKRKLYVCKTGQITSHYRSFVIFMF